MKAKDVKTVGDLQAWMLEKPRKLKKILHVIDYEMRFKEFDILPGEYPHEKAVLIMAAFKPIWEYQASIRA